MKYYNRAGKTVSLGQEFKSGGEGTLYQVKEQPDLIAKLYHADHLKDDLRQRKEHKLASMLANPPHIPTQNGHISLTWPTELLYDVKKQFVGYLMPVVSNAQTLLHVFTPIYRKDSFYHFTQRDLFRTAYNFCHILSALHQCQYVVGDLNEQNALVTADASVTLIDTDSFQVIEATGPQVIHYCTVGKGEYIAPELQGKDLKQTRRLPEHDHFALGVLICRLLMNGSHPFRAEWQGNGDQPSLETRIGQGYFPYGTHSHPVAPPKEDSLDALPDALFQLALRCFVDGHNHPRSRPTANDWKEALVGEQRYTEAKTLLTKKEYDAACDVLQKLLQEAPNHKDAKSLLQKQRDLAQLYWQANGYINSQQFVHASNILGQLLQIDSDYKDASDLQKRIEMQQMRERVNAIRQAIRQGNDVLVANEYRQLSQQRIQASGLSEKDEEYAKIAYQRVDALQQLQQVPRHDAQQFVSVYEQFKNLLEPYKNFTLDERAQVREARRSLLLNEFRQAVRQGNKQKIKEAGEKAILNNCLFSDSDWQAMGQA